MEFVKETLIGLGLLFQLVIAFETNRRARVWKTKDSGYVPFLEFAFTIAVDHLHPDAYIVPGYELTAIMNSWNIKYN